MSDSEARRLALDMYLRVAACMPLSDGDWRRVDEMARYLLNGDLPAPAKKAA